MRRLTLLFTPLLILPLSAPAHAAGPCVAHKHGARAVHLCGNRVEAFHHRPKRNYARTDHHAPTAGAPPHPAKKWETPASPHAGHHLMRRRTLGEPIPSPEI
jgi:hypothetical protein